MSYENDPKLKEKIIKYLNSWDDFYDLSEIDTKESSLSPDQSRELRKLIESKGGQVSRKVSAAKASISKRHGDLTNYLNTIPEISEKDKDLIRRVADDNPLVKQIKATIPKRIPSRVDFLNNRDAYEEAMFQASENMFKRLKDKLSKKAIIPVLAGGAGLAASVAAEAFDAEEAGRGSDKSMTDSQQRDVELTRDISKEDDTLTQTRLRALQRMLGK